MPLNRRFRLVGCLSIALIVGCLFIDNPGPAETSGAGGGAADAGSDADAEAVVPPLCEQYGGYAWVEQVASLLVENVLADCRINGFFADLSPVEAQHIEDCLVKQLAVLTKCPGIQYDVDSEGADCRDMATAHHGLGIRAADFEAFIEDVVAAFEEAGTEKADIDSMLPALSFLEGDVVTNSAPGLAKEACDAGDGG